MEGKNNQKA